jgi:hypothetical protein
MITQGPTQIKHLQTLIADAWDWPDTPGSRLTAADQHRLRVLSSIFSNCTGIAAGAASIALKNPLPVTLGVMAASVVVGHYTAGMWVNRTRSP